MVVQASFICGSEHFFHNAEADTDKSLYSGGPMEIEGKETRDPNATCLHLDRLYAMHQELPWASHMSSNDCKADRHEAKRQMSSRQIIPKA